MDFSHALPRLPLETDPNGTVRVGGTRVTLDTVVGAFCEGSTCEEIVFQFPVLALADVYAVVSFYLSHRGEVEKYLAEQAAAAAPIRREIQAKFPSSGIRERLLNRSDSLATLPA